MKLIKMSKKYKEQLILMMTEWKLYDEKIVPWAIRRSDFNDFSSYIKSLETGFLPIKESTFFLYDKDENILLGAVNIRHTLDEKLFLSGGHIGYGIRPTKRRKGYATILLRLALKEARKIGLEKVLIVCNKENVASAKTIIKCGGILENEIIINNKIEQRYWIEIN